MTCPVALELDLELDLQLDLLGGAPPGATCTGAPLLKLARPADLLSRPPHTLN